MEFSREFLFSLSYFYILIVRVRASIAKMNCTYLYSSILEPLLPTAYLVHIDCGVLNLPGPIVSFAGALN